MKVYVLHVSGYDPGDDHVSGVITDKAIADRYAEGRFEWYEEFVVDECLKSDLAYITRRVDESDSGEGPTGCMDDGDEMGRALRGVSHQDLNRILDRELGRKPT